MGNLRQLGEVNVKFDPLQQSSNLLECWAIFLTRMPYVLACKFAVLYITERKALVNG